MMKEITVVTTFEVTHVIPEKQMKDFSESAVISVMAEIAADCERYIKSIIDADSVCAAKQQFFVGDSE